jgi:dipeptidyl aminopeptidase/acylaminoacyl peptidase
MISCIADQESGTPAPFVPTPSQTFESLRVTLTTVPTATATPVTETHAEPASVLPSSSSTWTPAPDPTFTRVPTVTPSFTPSPYSDLTIRTMATGQYGDGEILIEDTIERTPAFTRYLFSYPSNDLRIFGYMNVPHDGVSFPAALLLHGYIDPDEYETVAYTRRYSDALAEAGYFVFHPNLRNYPPSDSGPDPYRIGLATDVLNLIAIIRQQSLDKTGSLRRVNRDEIHLWGHSMGGGVALRVLTVNNDGYLKAAVLYGAMSGDERLNYQRILKWSGGHRGEFELDASETLMRQISPIYHLERIQAPISIHHSDADDVVPLAWSNDLCQRLRSLRHPVECFTYVGQPHTFRGAADTLFTQRTIDFFDRH